MRGATLRQLRAFSLVARHQSFVRAAAELHLSQPAVSMQIKELEQVVGLPLFERNGKDIALTRAGELLLVDVRRAMDALQDAEDMLCRLRQGGGTRVNVGIVSNASYFAPQLIARFGEEHRDVHLHPTFGNREWLLEQLRHGDVDLAIMGTPPLDLETHAAPFAVQPLGIVAAPGHPLARERAIPVSALRLRDFIVRETGSGTRAAMERFFREAGVEPFRCMEMTSNEAIKQAVMASAQLAFLSLHTTAAELERQALVVLDVVGLPVVRRWYVASLDEARLPEAARTLRTYVLAQGSRLIAEAFCGTRSLCVLQAERGGDCPCHTLREPRVAAMARS